MKKMMKVLLPLLAVTGFAGVGHAADATSSTGSTIMKRKPHPRIKEVNEREKNQQKQIGNEIKNGDVSAAQGAKLEGQEAKIKKEERADVKANGGSLTKAEQRKINRQENHVEKQIQADKAGSPVGGAPAPVSPPAPSN